MFKEIPVVALVPARAGSKGVPNKNLIQIDGSPLAIHALLEAQKTDFVDQLMISTDSEELLKFAERLEFLSRKRPKEISADTSVASEVIQDAINYLRETKGLEDFFILYLQPTSPLRNSRHIHEAFIKLEETNSISVVSVVSATESAYKQIKIESGQMIPLFPERLRSSNRQNYAELFLINGAIYLFKASDFERNNSSIPFENSACLVMTIEESLDIDTPHDVELLFEALPGRVRFH